MAKEWDKLGATFKKLQPQIRKIDPSKAEKQVKLTKAALKTAWDDEEKFIKALKAARKAGAKGKKPADFVADPGFKQAHAALIKSASRHKGAVDALQSSCDEARALDKLLVKLLGEIKKNITRGNKEQAGFQTGVQDAQTRVRRAATLIGKLTAPELFYGAQITRVVDKIINKSKDSGPSGDAGKLLEEKELKKNVKAADKLAAKVSKQCNDAYDRAGSDPKTAEPLLKKVVKLIGKLEAIDKPYQRVKKKNADLIKKSRDKAKINKAMAAIAQCHDDSVRAHREVAAQVKELAG